MGKTEKYSRKSGATTVTRDGKIIGNIGTGKTHIPTVQTETRNAESSREEKLAINTISSAGQKFYAAQTEKAEQISYETGLTLWSLTSGENYSQRFQILSHVIENMTEDERQKLIEQIATEQVMRPGIYNPTGAFAPVLSGKTMGEGLDPVPKNVLYAFANVPRNIVKTNVAKNPNTSSEALNVLAEDTDYFVLMYVTKHNNVTTEILNKVYGKTTNGTVMGILAESAKTSPEVFSKLAQHDQISIVTKVAKNPICPPEVLAELSKSNIGEVRVEVAKNPNTPVEVLKFLSEDKSRDVLLVIALNPNIPEHIKKAIAADKLYSR